MKKYNVIVILDKDMKNTLMCKRTKDPYMGMYNLVGGKIEKDNDGINEAYRELVEETNISKEDTNLINFMNIEYVSMNKVLEVYFGILNKEVKLIEEVNKLEWVSIEDNFFDMKKYAGEGNIGHIIEEIKIYLNSKK
jgi:hydrolase, NUDIX family